MSVSPVVKKSSIKLLQMTHFFSSSASSIKNANMQSCIDTLSRYISDTDILILAISGGVDSMVLLDFMMKSHPKSQIIVAHFDHSLRGSESDGDREFVVDFCKKEKITFEVEKMDIASRAVEQKMSIESIARKYRYAFFARVAEIYHADYILTAHHGDDRIETAVFNLIRGTKLGGIHALGESTGSILRPFLSLTKWDILEYAKEHHIGYREDSSNTEREYLRNKLRHDILPQFASINPEYRRAITHFIEYTEEMKEWIDSEVVWFLGEGHDFSLWDFREKSPFFQKEIIRYLYEQANCGTIGLSEGNIEEMLRYILTADGGTEKVIKNLRLSRRWGEIIFEDSFF